jgi:hypothetical protein
MVSENICFFFSTRCGWLGSTLSLREQYRETMKQSFSCQIAAAQSRLERARRLETTLLQTFAATPENAALGAAFALAQRHVEAVERSYYRALRELGSPKPPAPSLALLDPSAYPHPQAMLRPEREESQGLHLVSRKQIQPVALRQVS